MDPLNGEEVISAISTKISQSFSKSEIKKIYKNKPVQAMERPCVFIHQIDTNNANEMRGRGSRSYLIDVRVHPPSDETLIQSWGIRIGERMKCALNSIIVSGRRLKYSSIECRIEDNVLHCIVVYSFKVLEISIEKEKMEKLKYLGEVK